MDPWSKVDYSRVIRETSMVEGKLPEVIPPSDRVPARGLLALLVLEARRRRIKGEITKNGSLSRRIPSRRIYRRRGAARGATRGPGAPLARPSPRPPQVAAWGPGGSHLVLLLDSGRFLHADFYLIFPNFRSTFNMGEN